MCENYRDPGVFAGRDMPDYMKADTGPLPKRMPENPTAYHILILQSLHYKTPPPLRWTGDELDHMGDDERNAILREMNERLGIKPILTRRLGHVIGEDEDE
jgi:hypothetical protein